ncbi:hypothetical protein GSI_09838 [Ganoderma sinense ZZ0214-1]|uniref:Uncharacterized protein n=1 Tax=Ganoderma sinense ZZ0214-1 TaxID=1077348 RepID=A0A2G8S2W3_9APHY|nr:hypothetical protein GSI_09838 [Ganoderma sinense ZZ0214-1]
MASIPYPAPSATFRSDVYNNSVQGVTHRLMTFGLLSGLYGVLTVLSVLSMCTLLQRVKTSATAVVLSLTILALLTSTTIYVVTSFLNYQTSELTSLVTSAQEFWSYSTTVTFPKHPPTHVKNYTQLVRPSALVRGRVDRLCTDASKWRIDGHRVVGLVPTTVLKSCLSKEVSKTIKQAVHGAVIRRLTGVTTVGATVTVMAILATAPAP